MSAYQTEEEQIESLKRWWQANGTSTLMAIAAAFAIYFGWQAWQNHQKQESETLSNLFQTLQSALTTAPGETLTPDQLAGAQQLIDEIKSTDSGSKYAVLGEFYAAKMAVDANDFEQAITSLQWIISEADQAEDVVLAKLRVARIYLAQKEYDQALSMIDTSLLSTRFSSLFAELQGDAYVGKGDLAKARTAYEKAMADENIGQRQLIVDMKLSDLGLAEAKDTSEGSDS